METLQGQMKFLLSFLTEKGIACGMAKKNVDCDRIEKRYSYGIRRYYLGFSLCSWELSED